VVAVSAPWISLPNMVIYPSFNSWLLRLARQQLIPNFPRVFESHRDSGVDLPFWGQIVVLTLTDGKQTFIPAVSGILLL